MKGLRQAKLVEVIQTENVIGDGTENNPVRTVVQYWDKQGKLICTCTKDDYLEGK